MTELLRIAKQPIGLFSLPAMQRNQLTGKTCLWNDLLGCYLPSGMLNYTHVLKPGFHPNAIACVACIAFGWNATQAIAFGWKPDFTQCYNLIMYFWFSSTIVTTVTIHCLYSFITAVSQNAPFPHILPTLDHTPLIELFLLTQDCSTVFLF